ncbi:hypothetical protein TPHA_0L01660 [Tetrapisispora phaffii CBS 4417]|uniref:Bud emergence protein 1 n=1 Tax=Tetrapisispora phaffii (strain ATCC 24235 / CBS 4417 / NBRC 1672 / NRRL Y-8282 / UCD 70-5) TaxID=1071381 RepID=G8C041_TETPH|nr:hypothetical protein TPHA_0L01660 [Tetrapisispora phaffii CBS 4417]CCE65519.1 hypothetical protein TPHA_0L01660 [Tetrapisispora phaffii CBS 4417]
MLKGFKLSKRDSQGKGRITSADISGPTRDTSELLKHSRTMSVDKKRVSSSRGRHSSNISSPERVIRALYNYRAQSSEELSFLEGEFFYVEEEEDEWYKASNPNSSKVGMVPKSYFEIINKTRPPSVGVHSNGGISRQQSNEISTQPSSLYGIVLYDFQAEKADELTAYVGENLFICAHHNYEWFIAKPIGRLGGPGLVPIDFVSIIDISTGFATGNKIKDDIIAANLPTVKEWKSNVTKYKNSNIALGSVDHNQQSNFGGVGNIDEEYIESPIFDSEVVKKASVVSYLLEDDKYWFTLICELSNGKSRKLKRYYQDFYDLQVKLLDTFPSESGKLRNSSGQWTKRILPYIPGPVPQVTESITNKRKDDLNIYVSELVHLPDYISRCDYVKYLFAIKNNGYDEEFLNTVTDSFSNQNTETLMAQQLPSKNELNLQGDNTLTGEDLQLYEKMGELSLDGSKQKSRPPSSLPPQLKPTKIKFYYNDDIFALMLKPDTMLSELRSNISTRIDGINFKLEINLSNGETELINSDSQVSYIIQNKLKINVIDN